VRAEGGPKVFGCPGPRMLALQSSAGQVASAKTPMATHNVRCDNYVCYPGYPNFSCVHPAVLATPTGSK